MGAGEVAAWILVLLGESACFEPAGYGSFPYRLANSAVGGVPCFMKLIAEDVQKDVRSRHKRDAMQSRQTRDS